MIANGLYLRDLRKVLFWEQSAALVTGERLWESHRSQGKSVAMLFWQQCMGEAVDMLISPAPVHKHHGGMVQSCYEKPDGLYQQLSQAAGHAFNLMHYWGPMASVKSSDWIANATAELLSTVNAPDLCFTYLPALDYDLQRYGPNAPQAEKALAALFAELDLLMAAAEKNGYDIVVFGDYAITQVDQGAALPNLALQKAGLLKTRDVGGRLYPDLHLSGAFAVVDHEIAHVYTRSEKEKETATAVLSDLDGVERVLDTHAQKEMDIAHARSGDLVLVAENGYWFAYPWWSRDRDAPDYAQHVDIHSKPGYDPCELFFGWPPFSISRDTQKIRGTHGKTGPGREAAWATSCSFDSNPESILDLSGAIKKLLE